MATSVHRITSHQPSTGSLWLPYSRFVSSSRGRSAKFDKPGRIVSQQPASHANSHSKSALAKNLLLELRQLIKDIRDHCIRRRVDIGLMTRILEECLIFSDGGWRGNTG